MALRFSPEGTHIYETTQHEVFLTSLTHCANKTKSLDSLEFSQCIKSAGLNFGDTFRRFDQYKTNAHQYTMGGLNF